jgi:hypothetical protein
MAFGRGLAPGMSSDAPPYPESIGSDPVLTGVNNDPVYVERMAS